MNHPGTTTHEPTLLHLFALLAVVTVVTYPCSIVLVFLRIIKPARDGASLFIGAIRRANEVLRAQMLPFLAAWLGGCVVCILILLAWVFVGGVLVAAGLMEPVDDVINIPLLTTMGFAHLVAQAFAYRFAIRESAWVE